MTFHEKTTLDAQAYVAAELFQRALDIETTIAPSLRPRVELDPNDSLNARRLFAKMRNEEYRQNTLLRSLGAISNPTTYIEPFSAESNDERTTLQAIYYEGLDYNGQQLIAERLQVRRLTTDGFIERQLTLGRVNAIGDARDLPDMYLRHSSAGNIQELGYFGDILDIVHAELVSRVPTIVPPATAERHLRIVK